MNKIIFYYQTFTSLKPIIDKNIVTHIHLSAIHFGINKNGSPYIHLNDYPPSSSKFNKMWSEIKECQKNGIKIILMLGGAGGAFNDLFEKYNIYFPMLIDTIKAYNLDGIDLDIEESVDINNVKMLMDRLICDFGKEFIITMAPLSSSLQNDGSSMGNFNYKDLYNSKQGKYISWFNTQCYDLFSEETFNLIIKNGYPFFSQELSWRSPLRRWQLNRRSISHTFCMMGWTTLDRARLPSRGEVNTIPIHFVWPLIVLK